MGTHKGAWGTFDDFRDRSSTQTPPPRHNGAQSTGPTSAYASTRAARASAFGRSETPNGFDWKKSDHKYTTDNLRDNAHNLKERFTSYRPPSPLQRAETRARDRKEKESPLKDPGRRRTTTGREAKDSSSSGPDIYDIPRTASRAARASTTKDYGSYRTRSRMAHGYISDDDSDLEDLGLPTFQERQRAREQEQQERRMPNRERKYSNPFTYSTPLRNQQQAHDSRATSPTFAKPASKVPQTEPRPSSFSYVDPFSFLDSNSREDSFKVPDLPLPKDPPFEWNKNPNPAFSPTGKRSRKSFLSNERGFDNIGSTDTLPSFFGKKSSPKEQKGEAPPTMGGFDPKQWADLGPDVFEFQVRDETPAPGRKTAAKSSEPNLRAQPKTAQKMASMPGLGAEKGTEEKEPTTNGLSPGSAEKSGQKKSSRTSLNAMDIDTPSPAPPSHQTPPFAPPPPPPPPQTSTQNSMPPPPFPGTTPIIHNAVPPPSFDMPPPPFPNSAAKASPTERAQTAAPPSKSTPEFSQPKRPTSTFGMSSMQDSLPFSLNSLDELANNLPDSTAPFSTLGQAGSTLSLDEDEDSDIETFPALPKPPKIPTLPSEIVSLPEYNQVFSTLTASLKAWSIYEGKLLGYLDACRVNELLTSGGGNVLSDARGRKRLLRQLRRGRDARAQWERNLARWERVLERFDKMRESFERRKKGGGIGG